MSKSSNRKLLTSVYTPQEAREAILGGARIIDSEDPKSALGNISPLKIMDISSAVLDYSRNLELQLSTNIGEDQLIFRRGEDGRAMEKSPLETAGKAAQAALGVALSMGTRVHPCNIVKVGLDGMPVAQLTEVLSEVVRTFRRTAEFKQCQVMSVLFAQDLRLWKERKNNPAVVRELCNLREFALAKEGENEAFDLAAVAADSFRTPDGAAVFGSGRPANLKSLQDEQILPPEATSTWVRLNDPAGQRLDSKSEEKTSRATIVKMVDATVAAGADAMMLDTSILLKVCNVGLVAAKQDGMTNLSQFIERNGMLQDGVLSLADLEFFVQYAHYRGIIANLAGSIESYQAQQLWARIPGLDQISTRGAASAPLADPFTLKAAADNRQRRTIVRQLVRGLAPPEHGGVLNVPIAVRAKGHALVQRLCEELGQSRQKNGEPPLSAYYVDARGPTEEIQLDRSDRRVT
jgi:uncharacterized protein (UPF0264 family)